jgi:DNA-binding HxlR family transcriptional regulator
MKSQNIASQCSIARASQLLGDGWTLLLLRELFWGASRYEDFQANTGIASNVLAVRLKRLLEAEVVSKQPVEGDGRRFDYALTQRGRELFPLIMGVMAWGDKYTPGEKGPLVLLLHSTCGKRTKPGLVCTACGEAIKPHELQTEFNPRYEELRGMQRNSGARSLAKRADGQLKKPALQ